MVGNRSGTWILRLSPSESGGDHCAPAGGVVPDKTPSFNFQIVIWFKHDDMFLYMTEG